MANATNRAMDIALGKLTDGQQRELLPLLEATLADALVTSSTSGTPDVKKAALCEAIGEMVKAIRQRIISMASPQPAKQRVQLVPTLPQQP